MQVLLAGFDDDEMDRVSQRIQDGGHAALGATGPASARSLLAATSPSFILVPPGSAGELARGWVLGELGEELILAVEPDEDPLNLLEAGPVSTSPATVVVEHRAPDVAESTELALPTRAPAPATGPNRTPTSTPTSDLEPVDRLAQKLQQVRFASYHEVLEIEKADTAYQIRQHFEKLRGEFSPQGWLAPLSPDDVLVLDEIGQGIEEAYSVLGQPEFRSRYEQALTQAALQADRDGGR